MAKMKMGTKTGFMSINGEEIMTGDEVVHSVTGVAGVVNAYSSVVNIDGSGTNRLSNNVWAITRPYCIEHPAPDSGAEGAETVEGRLRRELYDARCEIDSLKKILADKEAELAVATAALDSKTEAFLSDVEIAGILTQRGYEGELKKCQILTVGK